MLEQAAKFLGQHEVKLMADSGVENINETVDKFLGDSAIERVLAQVEVCESNSMIEALWRSLRNQWLYLHELDSIGRLRAIVEFYVDQHNGVMPHAAFDGQTPDEMFFGTGAGGREGAGRETKVGPLGTAGREPIPFLCGLLEDGVLQ